MAKALGTTPEEEHRSGLAPLARVSTLPPAETVDPNSHPHLANKRASRAVIYKLGTSRSN